MGNQKNATISSKKNINLNYLFIKRDMKVLFTIENEINLQNCLINKYLKHINMPQIIPWT